MSSVTSLRHLNQSKTKPNLEKLIDPAFQDSAPSIIICTVEYAKLLNTALNELEKEAPERSMTVIWVDRGDGDLFDFETSKLVPQQYDYEKIVTEKGPEFVPMPLSSIHQGYQMYYTSGTTGFPKGALIISSVQNRNPSPPNLTLYPKP